MLLQVEQGGCQEPPEGRRSQSSKTNSANQVSPPQQLICSSGGGQTNNLDQALGQTALREGKREERRPKMPLVLFKW